ncbi:hypothetical protein C0995_001733 [Termitomyces sp. Mi166|nr:hypothetical protein C0995_001733 [Termitomyces sp. Mi166\
MFFELPQMSVAFAQRVTLSLALKFCTWYSPEVPAPARLEIPLPPPPTHTVPFQPTCTISIEHARSFSLPYLYLGSLGSSICVIFAAVVATVVLGTFFHVGHTTYLMILRVFSGPAKDVSTESSLLGPSVNGLACGPLAAFEIPDQDDYHPVSSTSPYSNPTPTLDLVLSDIQYTLYQSTSAPHALTPPDLEDNTTHATNPLNSFDSTSTSRAAPSTTLGTALSTPVPNTTTLVRSSPEGNTSLSSGIYSTEPFTNSETPTLHSSTLSLNATVIPGNTTSHPPNAFMLNENTIDTTTLDQHLNEAKADLENDVAALPMHASTEATDTFQPSIVPTEVICDNPSTLDSDPTTSIEPSSTELLINKLQEKVARKDRKLKKLNEKYRKLEEKLQGSHEQIVKRAHTKLKKLFSSIEIENANLKTENANLKTNSANLKAESTNLKTNIAGLKTNNANLKIENANLKIENANLKTNNANLKANNVSLKNHVTRAERMNDNLARTNNVLQRDVNDLRRSNDRLLREIAPPAYHQALAEGAVDEWSTAVVSGAAAFAPPRRFEYSQAQNLRVEGPPPPIGPPPDC